MKDSLKTKAQLIDDLLKIREHLPELNNNKSESSQTTKKSTQKFQLPESCTAMLIMDPNTYQFKACNKVAVEVIGVETKQDILALGILDISASTQYSDKLSSTIIDEKINEALKLNFVLFKWKCKRLNGEIWDSEIHLSSIKYKNTKILQLNFIDISRIKQVKSNSEKSMILQRDFLNNTTSVVYIKDLEGRYLFINKMFGSIFNISPKEVQGKTDYDIFPREIAKLFRANDKKAIKSKSPIESEEITELKDGKHTYLSVKFPLRNLFGKIYGVCGISTDITYFIRAEEKLKKNENLYRQAINNADAVVYKRDFRTESFQFISKGIFEFTGYHPGELTQEIWLKIVQECVMRGKCDGLTEAEATKLTRSGDLKEWYADFRIISKDGKEHWLADSSVLLNDNQGNPVASLGILQDITERKRTEEKIIEAMLFNEQIIEKSPIGISIYDESGQCLTANQAIARIVGTSREEILQQNLNSIESWKLGRLLDLALKVFIDSLPIRKEIELITHAGKEIIIDCQLVPFRKGKNKNLLMMITDMTEYRKMQEIMLQSDKMLSVGGLAAGMAHEINNPLAGMMSTAEVMNYRLTNLHTPANQKAAKNAGTSMDAIKAFMEARGIFKMLNRISISGRRIAKIVVNMLSFAHRTDHSFSFCDLRKLMDQSVEIASKDCNTEKQYNFSEIKIIREYENNLPQILCESAKIQQVLLNILHNGAEAMLEEQANNTAKNHHHQFIFRLTSNHNTETVCIEIEDNGPGMDENTRKRVFEPFFTTKPPNRGIGLGLSVSYFIITENHDGRMSLESIPGKGTRFKINLPIKGKTHESGK
jgi:PAS domain S-box-containing protein